jgi:osmotically-inducible protein OsmY
MRRLLTGFVVAAVTAVVPTLVLAGNQEMAEQIAYRLKNSGQMSDYKIGVKYQNGTVWLRGHVANDDQMQTAVRLVFQTPSVNRVVYDELTVASSEAAGTSTSEDAVQKAAPSSNPLRNSGSPAEKKSNLVRRLESAVFGDNQEQPESAQNVASANRVPTAYTPAAVEPTAAEEPQELPRQMAVPQRTRPASNTARENVAMMQRGPTAYGNGAPLPMYTAAANRAGVAPARYDQPCMPNYAWPSYAAYPNYAGVTYPKQYSPTAWPYIGPFYPYPQVPMGWRKVTLQWDDGWWFLDFKDQPSSSWHR